ncbi:MAG: hypothetical protein HQK75_15950 [Candidatus Magnetomorum sp.]|nr:hypothetical protein [Candidatus Magnetomorum sp.]
MSSFFPSNAKALYQTGSLMAKISERLAGNHQHKNMTKDMVDEMKLASDLDSQVSVLKTMDEMVGSQIDLIA